MVVTRGKSRRGKSKPRKARKHAVKAAVATVTAVVAYPIAAKVTTVAVNDDVENLISSEIAKLTENDTAYITLAPVQEMLPPLMKHDLPQKLQRMKLPMQY